jgi:integration host factor subunit beta
MEKPVGHSSQKAGVTKTGIVKNVSVAAEIPLKDAETVVEIILSSIVRALRGGDKVELRHFGSFHTRQRRSRTARNPKTGAPVQVPAKTIPYFTPSKELKASVNS